MTLSQQEAQVDPRLKGFIVFPWPLSSPRLPSCPIHPSPQQDYSLPVCGLVPGGEAVDECMRVSFWILYARFYASTIPSMLMAVTGNKFEIRTCMRSPSPLSQDCVGYLDALPYEWFILLISTKKPSEILLCTLLKEHYMPECSDNDCIGISLLTCWQSHSQGWGCPSS